MSNKKDSKEELERFLFLCKRYSRCLTSKEFYKNKFDSDTLNRCAKTEGYKNWQVFLYKNGFISLNLYNINGEIKFSKELILDDIIWLYKDFYNKNNKYPSFDKDCKHKNNIPSPSKIMGILKNNGYNYILDFHNSLNNSELKFIIFWKIEDYEIYKSNYIRESKSLGRYIKFSELINYKNIPSGRWLINHCSNKNVTNFSQFVEWCGFIPRQKVSKEKVIEIILDMQSKLDRPLIQYDFSNSNSDKFCINPIFKYWRNFNNMKKELSLEITQENMKAKQKSFEDLKIDLIQICNSIYKKEGRKLIAYSDINDCEYTLNSQSYNSIFKQNGTTLRKFISENGFELNSSGRGLSFYLPTGEKILSQFELKFSNFLNEKLKLEYNNDYIRDIRYKEFITNYNGMLDCDYVINYNNRIIYIEIVGILRDYKKWYYDNRTLISKSKEKYRQKLMIKEQMLKENNLEYYLLFPSDLQEDFLLSIFNESINTTLRYAQTTDNTAQQEYIKYFAQ